MEFFGTPVFSRAVNFREYSETELRYYGVAICGAKKKVNKLTGSMALLR